MEVFFVNSIGLPFGSGVFFTVFIVLGSLLYGLYYSQMHGKVVLNVSLLALAFILIGYSSYLLVLVRSNFQPPINENDPSDLISFVSYLKREQYGDRPLLFGPTFMAEQVDVEEGAPVYRKGEEQYLEVDRRQKAIYDDQNKIFLPRVYSKMPGHDRLYRQWMGLREGVKPTFFDNMYYMFRYQFGHMYFRYFLWNFVGRESDEKDAGVLLPFEDAGVEMPYELAINKARNNFYMLPLVLGVLGFFFQLGRDDRSFWVLLLLWFLTGLALVLYLNSPPVEPRERDYIYVGSFYAFAIWIGLGVLQNTTFWRGK